MVLHSITWRSINAFSCSGDGTTTRQRPTTSLAGCQQRGRGQRRPERCLRHPPFVAVDSHSQHRARRIESGLVVRLRTTRAWMPCVRRDVGPQEHYPQRSTTPSASLAAARRVPDHSSDINQFTSHRPPIRAPRSCRLHAVRRRRDTTIADKQRTLSIQLIAGAADSRRGGEIRAPIVVLRRQEMLFSTEPPRHGGYPLGCSPLMAAGQPPSCYPRAVTRRQ